MSVPFAVGDPRPAWMLPAVKPRADVRDSREFGAPRRSGERVHAGIDLGAAVGDLVLAPESGRVVAIQGPTWSGTTPSAAMLIATDTGIVVNLGELDPDRLLVGVGDRVAKRQRVGVVGPTGMLHFETYRAGTTRTKQWLAGEPPPPALLDPTAYVQAAAADVGAEVADLPTWQEIRDAVERQTATLWPSSSTPPENRTPPSSSTPPENRTPPSSGDGGGLAIAVLLGVVAWGWAR